MRKLFYIDDTMANKISYWHLVAFLVALPFDFLYSEIILAGFFLHTLIHLRKSDLRSLLRKEVLVLISIYGVGLLSLTYSSDKQEGVNIAARQLAILLFPVLFALNGFDANKYRDRLFSFFVITCTATMIYLYADALITIQYFHLPASSLFTLAFMNHNFSLPIEMHATYLSMYVAFSIIVLIFRITNKKWDSINWLHLCCLFVLILGLLQLSSRSVFIALLLIINIVFPIMVFTGKQRTRFIFVSLLLSGLALYAIFNINSFRIRYVSELRKDLTQKSDLIEVNESRIARWKATLELIRGSPLIGYGLGSEKKLLKDKYFEKKLFTSFLNEFNSHSEYLSFLLKNGILGLLLFIYVLYTGFRISYRQKDMLFLSFMLLVSIVAVSENILDLNKGIFFYSFFFSLFLIRKEAPGLIEKQVLAT